MKPQLVNVVETDIFKLKIIVIPSNIINGKDITFLDKKSPYTYKNSLTLNVPKSGDLVILNNTTTKVATKDYIDNLLQTHTLLYKSNFPTIPYINIKSIIKYANQVFLSIDNNILGHANMFRLPSDTYIFRVKDDYLSITDK